MSRLVHISDAASLGLHVAAILAAQPHEYMSARWLAKQLGASEAHLAKVLQRLVKAGLVRSTRGPKGGFQLRRRPEEISQLDVFEAVEGQVERTDCLLGQEACSQGCIFGDTIRRLDAEFHHHLASTTLSPFPLKEIDYGEAHHHSDR